MAKDKAYGKSNGKMKGGGAHGGMPQKAMERQVSQNPSVGGCIEMDSSERAKQSAEGLANFLKKNKQKH